MATLSDTEFVGTIAGTAVIAVLVTLLIIRFMRILRQEYHKAWAERIDAMREDLRADVMKELRERGIDVPELEEYDGSGRPGDSGP